MTTFVYDIRHATRTLRQHPGYVTVVVLTLGFGIGINTATFSIVNAVLIRPLEFAEPGRLVSLHESLPDFPDGPFSPPDLLDFERDQTSFERVGAYLNIPAELSGSGEPVRLDGAKISATLFPVLGVAPLLGCAFTPEEDRPGIDVAILSWGLWQSRFAGDSSIVGRTITLDRRPYTVVGVMPASFSFPLRGPQFNNQPASVWIPMAFTDRQRRSRGNEFNHGVIGRLKDGVSLEQARAELDVLEERINANYSAALRNVNFSTQLTAVPLRDEVAGRTERPLLLLLATVGLVLLVTCANVANLVLSRAASRSREIAVRTALGSSRGRLLQLLLAEAVVLSIAGGLLGLLASRLMIGLTPASVADALPAVHEISIDVRVLAFSAALAISTSTVFALIPLISVGRAAPGSTLQEEATRTTPGVRRHRVQAGLVVSTVMLAFVLLVGAGLFIRSFSALMETDAGFNPDGVLTASLVLPRSGYRTAASVRSFHQSLLTRAASLAGVRSAALMTDLPLERYERRSLSAENVNAVSGGVPPSTNLAVRTGADPRALASTVRSEINAIDSLLAIESIATMNARLGDVLAPRRFSAMTLGAFAIGALMLAAIGLYGLLAFNVGERRREIAVRLALGAAPPAILRMVVSQGLKLVSIGLAAGVVVSYLAARLVASLLYQTESHDVITFGSVPLMLMLIALVACALPAWRASRVEPISALRSD